MLVIAKKYIHGRIFHELIKEKNTISEIHNPECESELFE
jgi:hypothetical protein